MALTLILTRHAKSGWDDPTLGDHDRPLNARGRADAPRIGAWLAARGHLPDAALVSSARRTLETWDLLSPAFGRAVPMTVVPGLYHAEAGQILSHIRTAQAQRLLLIGHNPGIAEVADRIVTQAPSHPRFADYPTCATLVATFDADDWADIDWHGGSVVDFIVPRDLP